MTSFIGWSATLHKQIDPNKKWALAAFAGPNQQKYYCVADRDTKTPYCQKHIRNTETDATEYINSVNHSSQSLCPVCGSMPRASGNVEISFKIPTVVLPVTDFPSAVIKYIHSIQKRALEDGRKEKKKDNESWNTIVVRSTMENELPAEINRILTNTKNQNIIELAGMLAVATLKVLWPKIADQIPILTILRNSMKKGGYPIEFKAFKKFSGFFKKDASNIALYIESDAEKINKVTKSNPSLWEDEVNRKKQSYYDAFVKYLDDPPSKFGSALACAIIAGKIIEYKTYPNSSKRTADLTEAFLKENVPSAPKKSSKWEEHQTEEGTVYYHNTETQETQWEKPK